VAHFGSLLNLASVAAQAGWLAYNHPFLVTARIVGGSPLGYARYFLGVQLLRAITALASAAPEDAFVRFLADYYPPCAVQEMEEVTSAAANSLAEARRRGWQPREFLLDALAQGRALAHFHPTRAHSIITETGTQAVERLETTFEEAVGKSWRTAGPAETWGALQVYLCRAFPRLVSATGLDAGLLVLRRSYDFLFWYALLAEVRPLVSHHQCIIRMDLRNHSFPQTSSAGSYENRNIN
jgi:hypothetical protein